MLTEIRTVTARAPASCANYFAGYDILGCAFDRLFDTVTLEKRKDHRLVVISNDNIPQCPDENTATVAMRAFLQTVSIPIGFDVIIKKGIPIASGLGGSAASAVAAIIALRQFFKDPICLDEAIKYALIGESYASGQVHGDNVIPCFIGGLALVQSVEPLSYLQLPTPKMNRVIVHPDLSLETRKLRKILPKNYSQRDCIQQYQHVASFVAGLYLRSHDILEKHAVDLMATPYRLHAYPVLNYVRNAALEQGARMAGISGAGPTMMAMVEDQEKVNLVMEAMQLAFKENGIDSMAWQDQGNSKGAWEINQCTM